jgi:GNAT superfamily N-acetyltransferase
MSTGEMTMRLRRMTAADIPAGLALCRAAHWNQIDRDWQRYLRLHPAGARVAVDSGDAVIGTVTTLRFDGGFDWIAMVLVAPEYRRQGIGRRLVEEAIDRLGGRVPVRLDATPAGELVYRKLAFVPEYALARLERVAGIGSEPSRDEDGVHAMGDEDLAEVLAMDREVAGVDRGALLRLLRQDAPDYAIIDRQGSRLEGYAFGREGFSFDHLGPIVARDERAARRLVDHVVRGHPRTAFLLDVPRDAATWVAWLGQLGFREQRGFVRLVRGAPAGVTSPCSDRLFATMGADLG